MTKDHYLVRRSEGSEVRHGKPNEILCVGLRVAHSDLQFIMMIYQLEMVLLWGTNGHWWDRDAVSIPKHW